jgi:hypothetical protein
LIEVVQGKLGRSCLWDGEFRRCFICLVGCRDFVKGRPGIY